MATVANQIQQIYIGLLGRAADAEGLAYWTDEIESGALTLEQLRANIVEEQPEYLQSMGQMTRAQVVNQLYQNLFNRSAEAEGLDYWVNGGGSSVNVDQLVLALIDGAQAADTLALDNKTAVAEYYTEAAGDGYTAAAARAAIADVDGESDLAAARAAVDARLEQGGDSLTLTQRADDLQGADGVDTTFTAPVTQNETGSGELANTFETGDVLDGGADSTNVLRADLIATGAIGVGGFQSPAISAETTNIQEVNFRAQNIQGLDLGSNTTAVATIDAEKMVGVEQWWTDNSRADVRIEDVRSRPTDTILGMRNTDPEVGFEVYFNPLFMDGGQSSQSQLVIQIAELDGGVVNTAAELANISVNALSFELDGDAITISSDAMAEANTWEELEAAIVAALAEEGLGDLQVTRGDEGQFLLFDAEGREFSNQGGFTASATTDQQIDIRNRITQDLQTEDEQTETTLVLDGAGNGSRGGDVNIAAMSGDRGVEVFNVQVDNDSHIRTLRSENNPNNTGSYAQEQQLEEVYLTHVEGGAQGALQLGSRTVEQSGVSTTTDDRLVTDGLLDVRVFDAAGYAADIKLGASLTDAVFDKYLADAEETVQFSYLLGDGNNNLSLFVDNGVASDPDFALEIVGGAGDDRINLTGLSTKASTEIDGGEGRNIVETDTSTGTSAANTWAGFDNIQTLVVAGGIDTTQNLVAGNMEGLEEVIIATGDVNTTVQQMRMDQDLTISGKNQTLGQGNSNDDQNFGTVTISNTSAVPGVNSFGVLLDNTARVDGELTVAELNVDGADNAISTLDLTSAGRRDTSNLVQSAALAGVNTVNLDGSQNLDLHIASMATGASVVDGSELGGDLDLAMNAALLNGSSDVLTGTEGESDRLYVYGTDATATVTEFETVQLGLPLGNQFTESTPPAPAFSGVFDAAAVSGVDQYDLVNLDAATTLDNLGNDELITVASGADQDITLNAASESAQITVDFLAGYTSDLTVVDYRTVTLDLAGSAAGIDYDFDLTLNDGTDPTYARTLEITGGVSTNDSIKLGTLDTALTTIDYSAYTGSFVSGENLLAVSAGANYATANGFGWNDTDGSNAKIIVNSNAFQFSVAGDDGTATAAATNFITEFVFTSDAESVGTVWQIDDFQVFGAQNSSTQTAPGSLQDRTLLNLRELDLSETDVSQRDLSDWWVNDADQAEYDADFAAFAGAAAADDHTVIVGNEDENFTILLTGVTVGDLNDENFLYA